MNSKKTKLYMLGAMALLTSTALVSCEDANDWTTDSAYDRLFMPSGLSVSADATEAELSWKSTPGTQYYIVELSTDSLFGLVDEYRVTSQVLGEDGSITKSPYQLADLDNSTKYFVRVKGCSEVTASSNWAYLENISFQTKSENILGAVGSQDKGQDFITLNWAPGAVVTHVSSQEIIGTSEEGSNLYGEEVVLQLSAEDKANGHVTITGLKESTGYLLSIYNNTSVRGSRIATTTMAVPDADLVIELPQGETLTQDLLDSWADKGSVVVVFAAGATYDIEGIDPANGDATSLNIPTGLSLTFYGAEGDNKPVLNIKKEIVFRGTHAFLKASNIAFNDAGATYFFNQGIAMSVSEILFTDCEFNNFARSIVRFKDQKSMNVDNLKFEGCLIYNQGYDKYALITLDAKEYSIGNIEFNDCTFDSMVYTGLALNHGTRGMASVNTVSFNDCTLYNSVGSGRYLLDAGSTSQGPAVTINRTLFGKTADPAARGMRTASVVVDKTYVLNDGVYASNAIKGLTSYDADSDAVFVAPTTGNFTIKDSKFPENVGATRWYYAQ